jgi:Dinucleotide-utilizing enzymes involved in molybdopterin and thiamine biosynthesis family 2
VSASLSGKDFIRYSRQIMLPEVGEEGQQKLLSSRVLIVGLGGLGSPVSLYLAAAGVGHLILCDQDVVDVSNLQRQVVYKEADCGKPKVSSARNALMAINPSLNIEAVQAKVEDAAGDFDVDLVIDCTDNYAARHWMNRHCRVNHLPFISGAALGWEGQMMTFDFRQQQSPCLACALPENAPEPAATCATVGVVGPVLGLVGSLQATAAIRTLLGSPLKHGQMQRYDAARGQWLSLQVAPNPACVCSQ